ncbi:protealysin inhibitor emfourin [Paracoccus shandongensis]|uniref:protealysin inhibitor emfourin n=1 Tax=Paracoccus shandongensis TaxID=2816048 RepID=UPI001A8CC0B4|nr:protealysin inhibitor emfourin [Paracoccus shandongensis]
MIIEIAAQGGFGGIKAANLRKTIDVSDQPEQMRQELAEAFGPDELARLSRQPCGDCADRLTYRITVTEDRETRSFTLREAQIPPDMLDLIDQM